MSRVAKPLTDAKVKSAKPKDKKYKLYDGNGVFIAINPSGKKSFGLKYKINGKYRELILGVYPILSLKEARKKAMELLQKIENGIDPLEEKKSIRNKKVLLFRDVAKEFINFKEEELSYSHYSKQIRRLDIYILPKIGDMHIEDITKSDLIELIKAVRSVKTNANKKGDKIETTRRIYMLLKQIYKFALHNDYVKSNIMDAIDINSLVPKKEQKSLKAVIDTSEIKTIYRLIKNYPGIVTGLALQFLALAALRPGNVRDLRWEWVDRKNRVIVIPSKYMKNRKEFRLPISSKMLEVLNSVEEFTEDSNYVFCSPMSKSKPISENTLNFAHKRLGIENHSAHGWRSAFSTICYKNQKEHGYSSEIIESQLAHNIGNAVTRAYMRSDFLEERLKLLEWWANFLEN